MKVVHKKVAEKQKSLLVYADWNCTTGFGAVAKELVNEWAKDKKLSIVIFGINDLSTKVYDYLPNVKVIPALITGDENSKKDIYRRIELLKLIYQSDFDALFFLQDVEVINTMEEQLRDVKNTKRKENRPNFKSMIYFPVDSEPRLSDLKVLQFFDEVVTYTEYAKSVMKPLITDTQFKKIKIIPHGTNSSDFYPYSDADKLKAKKEMFGSEDVFVFGSVNRNQVRKDFGSLIMGFAMFKHTSGANALLYLHCNPIDPMGINIYRLCERVGLEVGKDVIVPKDYSENKGCTLEELNKIYNSFDCFITTTTSEGWGLTITEAMATKCLVICPKHTSLTEITDNGANTLNFMFSQQAVFVNDFEKIRFTTNPLEVKTLCEVAYGLKNDEPELQEMVKVKIENAYNKVSGMKWEGIAKQFKVIIDRLTK
jgi:glycosyltransferase involved in cell wall biosynthesis